MIGPKIQFAKAQIYDVHNLQFIKRKQPLLPEDAGDASSNQPSTISWEPLLTWDTFFNVKLTKTKCSTRKSHVWKAPNSGFSKPKIFSPTRHNYRRYQTPVFSESPTRGSNRKLETLRTFPETTLRNVLKEYSEKDSKKIWKNFQTPLG